MDDSKVFVVTSGKGGVGKTTVTANVGACLALLGYNVCLIDADIGLKNLDLVLGLENRVVYTIIDVVRGNKDPLEAVVKHKLLKNLNLLASSQIANKDMVSEQDMINLVNELSKHYHYIIIDCPAGIERGFKNSIAPAQQAIIVTTPELTAISDADRVIGMLENQGFSEQRVSLIVNRLKPRMVQRDKMVSPEEIKNALAVELLGVVPDSEEIIVSTNEGNPLVLDEKNRLSVPFKNIAQRILGNPIPISEDISGSSEDGFLGFIKKLLGRR